MIQGKYYDDTFAIPELDEDAYLYVEGATNKGICYGLGFATWSALRLLGSMPGSSRGSQSSPSTDKGPPSHHDAT